MTALIGIINPEDAPRRLDFFDALSASDDWFTHDSLAQQIGLQPDQIPHEFRWLTYILKQANGGEFTWRDYMEWGQGGHYRLPANFRDTIRGYLDSL